MPMITWPLASLPLPHRLALAEKRRDAFGGVFEREHAAELAFEHAQLRLELEILRAIERAQAECERGRAAIGELAGERHRRGLELRGRHDARDETACERFVRGELLAGQHH